MPFTIIRNDITAVRADAIVNTANPAPVIGEGTALNFKVVSEAVCTMRAAAPLEAGWKDEIDSDFRRRHRE